MECVALYGVTLLGLLLGIGAVMVARLRDADDAWLAPGGRRPVAEGAYRSGPVTADPRVMRRRWLVLPVGILNGAVAIVTGLVLVPVGALGVALFSLSLHYGGASGDEGFALAAAVIVLDGLALSVGLVRACVALPTGRPGSASLAVRVGAWSLAHHAAVALVALYPALAMSGGDRAIVTFSFVAAGVGALAALTLLGAGLVTRRLPASEEGTLHPWKPSSSSAAPGSPSPSSR